MYRRLGWLLVPVALGTVLLSGCSGASQEELEAARQAGASEASAQASEQATQDQIDQLKKQIEGLQQDRKADRAAKRAAKRAERQARAAAGSSGGGTTSGLSGPVTACGDGIYAGSNTSCDFAMNVAGEYGSNPGAGSINAYSPVTGTQYTLSCSAWSGGGTVCTGGNNASVYLP